MAVLCSIEIAVRKVAWLLLVIVGETVSEVERKDAQCCDHIDFLFPLRMTDRPTALTEVK
jgi:hypothetical protein